MEKRRSGHEFFLFLDHNSQDAANLLAGEDWNFVSVSAKKLLVDHVLFANKLNPYHLDVFFHPDNVEFWRMPIPSVVTVHDLMPYKFPELILASDWRKRTWQKAYFRVLRSAIRSNSSGVITVSQHTKNDLLSHFLLKEEKIRVIYEGVEEHFLVVGRNGVSDNRAGEVRTRYQLSQNYIFYLGGINRHKNVPVLVDAYAKARQQGLTDRLVIGGQTVDDKSTGQNVYSELVSQIDYLGLSEQVLFPGFLAEEDLPVVYNQAKMFIYPSLYEGFGFTPLEAMASGCPVVCSNAASLPEVVGEGGILLSSDDVMGFAQAMLRLSGSAEERDLWRARGIARANQFSWAHCAQQTLSYLEEIGNA